MYFDDLPVGYRFATAERELTEASIIDFAKQYDPQPFHTDPDAARASPYGGLIASGFQTLLTIFNMELEANVWNEASMGSPGYESLQWCLPVRPGDRVRAEIEVTKARASNSKPDRGFTTMAHTVLNQRDEVVMRYDAVVILARHPDVVADL